MKITDIHRGKKYYSVVAVCNIDKLKGMKRRVVQTFYVVDVDPAGNRVCASLNKGPAQWFGKSKYGRWLDCPPAE